jgi:hypothetical protein
VSNPLRTASTFAVTVAIAYAACTFVFWLFPQAAASFMNGLFHGLDFRRLQDGASLFSFGGFLFALLGITGWAFLLGMLFGWLQGRVRAPS